jgi:hypothetical protein
MGDIYATLVWPLHLPCRFLSAYDLDRRTVLVSRDPSTPKPSSVGLWLPMSHQTAKGLDSSENTGIAVESEATA